MNNTISKLVESATHKLTINNFETPQLDARLLLSHASGLTRAELVSQANTSLAPKTIEIFNAYISRRLNYEPVARITGTKEFWGLEFALSPDTLVPRPDSETLIEAALKLYPNKMTPLKILDIGTGTGCLALALLHEYPNATAVALDISSQALKTAQINAKHLNLHRRIDYRLSNLTSTLYSNEKFHLIISNPPYIPSKDISMLMKEVKNFDPHLALDGGLDGFDFYKKLILQIVKYLAKNGTLLLELGIGQQDYVIKICKEYNFTNFILYNDISGIKRALSCTMV